MLEKIRARNYTALALLVAAKLFGIAGLAIGSRSRVLGGTLLVLDAVLILAAILLAIATMKARDREDDQQKEVLRQMMKEGTLKQYLRDLEAEEGTRKDAVS